jgi:hypothetical protein
MHVMCVKNNIVKKTCLTIHWHSLWDFLGFFYVFSYKPKGGCTPWCTQNLVRMLQFSLHSKIDVTYYTIGNGLMMKMCNQWWFTSKSIEILKIFCQEKKFNLKLDNVSRFISIISWACFHFLVQYDVYFFSTSIL